MFKRILIAISLVLLTIISVLGVTQQVHTGQPVLVALDKVGTQSATADPPQEVDNTFNVQYMMSGYCYAGSVIKDEEALGGFGSSSNFPLDIDFLIPDDVEDIYLVAQPSFITDFGGKPGMRLLLVNPTDEVAAFEAADSRLSIVQEALDENGKWRPIEYLPSSWCGNSYHRVMLDANQYWSFPAIRYAGSFQTKIRFRLDVHWEQPSIYSNIFVGSINPDQFEVHQPYQNKGIMDPYLSVSQDTQDQTDPVLDSLTFPKDP